MSLLKLIANRWVNLNKFPSEVYLFKMNFKSKHFQLNLHFQTQQASISLTVKSLTFILNKIFQGYDNRCYQSPYPEVP